MEGRWALEFGEGLLMVWGEMGDGVAGDMEDGWEGLSKRRNR